MNNITALSNQTLEVVSKLSFHASLVLLVVLALQFALGKKLSARWRYAMWGIVVARLLIPWNYDLPVVTETVYAPDIELAEASTTPEPSPITKEESVLEQPVATTTVPTQEPLATESSIPSTSASPPASQEAFQLPGIWTITFAVWLLGVILIPGTILVNHLRMIRRALATSSPPPSWILDTLDRARKEIGLTAYPTIHITPEVHAPTLVGAVRPKILLPENLIEESSPEEMRLFLLHELTHLKTGDIGFSWLWCIALSLHWFNPLLWCAGTRIRKDRELACDEAVLRQIGDEAKDDYARALLKAMEHITGKDTPRYRFGHAGIAENKSEMRRRVESILSPVIRSKRLRVASALTLTTILCSSFVQFVPISRFVDAQNSDSNSVFDGSELMRGVQSEMKRVKEREADGNVWKDRIDLAKVYLDIKIQHPDLSEDDLKKMLADLDAYAMLHEDDEDYGWRIWHLKSYIALDTKNEIVFGDDPLSFIFLWEALEHYPYTKYSVPSKHSKFQHLVNEMGVRIWDKDGLEAAEEYLVKTWKNDRRFQFFFEMPWQQRMTKEDIPLERLAELRDRLGDKPPLTEIEFILTPQGLRYGGVQITSDAELKRMLSAIENPADHFIAMGISTEDIPLKDFRRARFTLSRLVQELKFAYFSDIGLQRSDTSPTRSPLAESANLRAQCANHLKQLALSMKMFANESRGERFPRPDFLMMNQNDIYPKYVPDLSLLLCPADHLTLEEGMSPSEEAKWHFDNSNYWYLGHAMINKEQGRAYIDAFRKVIEEGDGNLDTDLAAPGLPQKTIFRLRNGIERLFITDVNNAAAGPLARSAIPILFELTDKHGPEGGNVLFLDGHVEFVKYPGKFPMTKEFIEGLRSLDTLKENRSARAVKSTKSDMTYTEKFISENDVSYFLDRIGKSDSGYHAFAPLWAAQYKAWRADKAEQAAIIEMALQYAEDTSRSFAQRYQCCYLASSFEVPTTIPRLSKLLDNDSNYQLRGIVACALGHFRAQEADEALKRSLSKQTNAELKTWITRALNGEFPRPRIWTPQIGKLSGEAENRNTNTQASDVNATIADVIFKGTYEHRSRGRAYPTPFELTLSRGADGAITATSRLPYSNTSYIAVGDKAHRIIGYQFSNPKQDDNPGYKQILSIEDGKVSRTRRGIREDEDDREISVPPGAFYDPNSRPDPYAAANIIFRGLNLKKGESKELDVYDTDNSGDQYAAYKIRIENTGKETLTVPAGTFEADHYILNQLSSADTWFKKRAGHITEFWILDNNIIIRIYRHREPYELVLKSFDYPETLSSPVTKTER